MEPSEKAMQRDIVALVAMHALLSRVDLLTLNSQDIASAAYSAADAMIGKSREVASCES